MAAYLYYIIETRKKNEDWKPFFLFTKYVKDSDISEDTENTIEKYNINNEEFYKKYIFCKSNWLLRDYVFSDNAIYKNNLRNNGLPNDISNISNDLIKKFKYGYNFTYFSLLELDEFIKSLEDKLTEDNNKEIITNFSINFCQRLGYGNIENSINEDEHANALENLNDLKMTHLHLSNFSYFIDELIDEQNDIYYPYEKRVILWIS